MTLVETFLTQRIKLEQLNDRINTLQEQMDSFKDSVVVTAIKAIDKIVISFIKDKSRYFIDRENGCYGVLIVRDKEGTFDTDIRKDLPVSEILQKTGLHLSRSHREELRFSFTPVPSVDLNGPFEDMLSFADSWSD